MAARLRAQVWVRQVRRPEVMVEEAEPWD